MVLRSRKAIFVGLWWLWPDTFVEDMNEIKLLLAGKKATLTAVA
jgi:hypothetical protein